MPSKPVALRRVRCSARRRCQALAWAKDCWSAASAKLRSGASLTPSPPAERAEQEKRIAAALIAAGPALFLDNFNAVTLKSAALASALTERPAQVREFGKLDFITLNALAFVALTGNGVVLAEDLVRRFNCSVTREEFTGSATSTMRAKAIVIARRT